MNSWLCFDIEGTYTPLDFYNKLVMLKSIEKKLMDFEEYKVFFAFISGLSLDEMKKYIEDISLISEDLKNSLNFSLQLASDGRIISGEEIRDNFDPLPKGLKIMSLLNKQEKTFGCKLDKLYYMDDAPNINFDIIIELYYESNIDTKLYLMTKGESYILEKGQEIVKLVYEDNKENFIPLALNAIKKYEDSIINRSI